MGRSTKKGPFIDEKLYGRIEELNRFSVGWTAYFAFADTPYPFERLDEWLRRRLRQVLWKQWKRVNSKALSKRTSRR